MGSFNLTNPKVAKFQLANVETKSTHRKLFEQLAATPNDTVPIEKTLLIWCTPRCGSTLFTEALNNSGRLGLCEEWFNNLYFKAWTEVISCNFDLMRYWEFIKRKSTRGTGVFTVKWHVGQFIAMHEDFDLSESTAETRLHKPYRFAGHVQAISFAVTSLLEVNQLQHQKASLKHSKLLYVMINSYKSTSRILSIKRMLMKIFNNLAPEHIVHTTIHSTLSVKNTTITFMWMG